MLLLKSIVIVEVGSQKRGGVNTAAASKAGRDGNGADRVNGGGCALYKNYSTNRLNAWKTHPTEACKKWNENGTAKPFNGHSTHGHGEMNVAPTSARSLSW